MQERVVILYGEKRSSAQLHTNTGGNSFIITRQGRPLTRQELEAQDAKILCVTKRMYNQLQADGWPVVFSEYRQRQSKQLKRFTVSLDAKTDALKFQSKCKKDGVTPHKKIVELLQNYISE